MSQAALETPYTLVAVPLWSTAVNGGEGEGMLVATAAHLSPVKGGGMI